MPKAPDAKSNANKRANHGGAKAGQTGKVSAAKLNGATLMPVSFTALAPKDATTAQKKALAALDSLVRSDVVGLVTQCVKDIHWWGAGTQMPWSAATQGCDNVAYALAKKATFVELRRLEKPVVKLQADGRVRVSGEATLVSRRDASKNVTTPWEALATIDAKGKITHLTTYEGNDAVKDMLRDAGQLPRQFPMADALWEALEKGTSTASLFKSARDPDAPPLPSASRMLEVLRCMRAFGYTGDRSVEEFPAVAAEHRTLIPPTHEAPKEQMVFALGKVGITFNVMADERVFLLYDNTDTGKPYGVLYTPIVAWSELVGQREAVYARQKKRGDAVKESLHFDDHTFVRQEKHPDVRAAEDEAADARKKSGRYK